MLIQCQSLSKYYNKGKENEVRALNGVTLTINQGDLCAVVGPSGSGKTTLLRMLGCLDVPTNGTCQILGVDTQRANDRILSQMRNEQIGFVLQDFGLIEDRNVYENIRVPLLLSKRRHKREKERIDAILQKLNIF